MIVHVHHPSSSLPELCILEFQGELIGEHVGTLGLLTIKSDDKVEMIIGNHFLEGYFHTLKSPLLIVDENARSLEDSDGISEQTSFSAPALHVQGVVRRKIIFKTRPKPAGKRNREQAEII